MGEVPVYNALTSLGLISCFSLWGNPEHLSYLKAALQEEHTEDKLHILAATRNSDSFTYDGIDVGGERVTAEIEAAIEELEKKGHQIKKLSMVGYSLGGLVARMCIGLLFSRGWFDKIEPVNFTTFATPHLGVRTPWRGYHSYVWNALGGRVLSISGRQLFLIDSFRDTGRPILSVLADPKSIFIKALSRFRNRVLYANAVNDRSAPFYTCAISRVDPYTDPEAIKIEYVKGYEPIVIVPDLLTRPARQDEPSTTYSRIVGGGYTILTKLPLYAMLTVFVPIGTVVLVLSSGIQSFRSRQRIRLHESGKAGIGLGGYRIPLMIENARGAVEGTIKSGNTDQRQEYLPIDTGNPSGREPQTKKLSINDDDQVSEKSGQSEDSAAELTRSRSIIELPTLALAPEQFEMIQALDDVGFRKYPVYIHKVNHSHAAIIYRRQKQNYDEGKVVVKHWLNEEFEL